MCIRDRSKPSYNNRVARAGLAAPPTTPIAANANAAPRIARLVTIALSWCTMKPAATKRPARMAEIETPSTTLVVAHADADVARLGVEQRRSVTVAVQRVVFHLPRAVPRDRRGRRA